MKPDVPPAWDKVFRCAECNTKVASIVDGKLRGKLQCPTHGELGNPSDRHWIKKAWSQHARDGRSINVYLKPV